MFRIQYLCFGTVDRVYERVPETSQSAAPDREADEE